jgi:peptide deformylase
MHLTSDGVERQLLIANPEIVSYSKQVAYLSSGEGCLSTLKVHDGIVPRKSKIVVEAIDLLADINGQKKITIEADGLFGICLQHEIDHLSGIMFYDHINKTNP